MKRNILGLIILGLVLFIGGCARTQLEKEVDKAVAEEPPRASHGELAKKGLKAIEESKTLSPKQKKQMRDLYGKIMRDAFKSQEEISKVKGVLFESITSTPYQPAKVAELKQRLLDLSNERMRNMFSALEEIEKIMGYMPKKERREFMQEALDWDRFQRGRF